MEFGSDTQNMRRSLPTLCSPKSITELSQESEETFFVLIPDLGQSIRKRRW